MLTNIYSKRYFLRVKAKFDKLKKIVKIIGSSPSNPTQIIIEPALVAGFLLFPSQCQTLLLTEYESHDFIPAI